MFLFSFGPENPQDGKGNQGYPQVKAVSDVLQYPQDNYRLPEKADSHNNAGNSRHQNGACRNILCHLGDGVVNRRFQVNGIFDGGIKQLAGDNKADHQYHNGVLGTGKRIVAGKVKHVGGGGKMNAQVALIAQRVPEAGQGKPEGEGQAVPSRYPGAVIFHSRRSHSWNPAGAPAGKAPPLPFPAYEPFPGRHSHGRSPAGAAPRGR